MTTAPSLRYVRSRTGTPSQRAVPVKRRPSGPEGAGNWRASSVVVTDSPDDEAGGDAIGDAARSGRRPTTQWTRPAEKTAAARRRRAVGAAGGQRETGQCERAEATAVRARSARRRRPASTGLRPPAATASSSPRRELEAPLFREPAASGARDAAAAQPRPAVSGGRSSRLSSSAFTATRMLEPDIEMAAISGRSVRPRGANTPAAIGSAMEL